MMLRAVINIALIVSAILGRHAPSVPDVRGHTPLELSATKGNIWAVLVAGAKDYYNYPMQADICHAYQIFHRHGIPDSNIIVMMYDDIAYNPQNPHQGVIINQPNGPNLYPGVLKDYTKKEVNPENFLNILTGNKKAMKGRGSGKVLESGPDDHVLVYFSDHGAPGLIAFPDSVLYADQLIKALETMHKNKMYKKLTIFIDTCESGSMFNNILPKNINIFATTSANPDEPAYNTYCDVKSMDVCLAGEYGAAWMEDIDSEDQHHKGLLTETLNKQFKKVVKRVKQSHPSEYGELSMGKEHVTDFLGFDKNTVYDNEPIGDLEPFKDSISVREVALEMLTRKINNTESPEKREELEQMKQNLIKGRNEIDNLFSQILSSVVGLNTNDIKAVEMSHMPLSLSMMPCYRTLVVSFSNICVNINENLYTLGHLYKLANLCVMQHSSADFVEIFNTVCQTSHRNLKNIN